MTQREASDLLELDAYEDLEEAFEFKLFEFKQFLMSKVPFEKTYAARLKQLEKIQSAYTTLGGESPNSNHDFDIKLDKPGDLLECWNRHQDAIIEWKLNLGNANSLVELKDLMDARLKMYKWYATNWVNLVNVIPQEMEVKASVEYDPMDILKAIKARKKDKDLDEMLLKETKRLILWLNLNNYE